VAAHEYNFITRWRVRAAVLEVFDILFHALDYPRWWPEVYLAVEEVAPPGPDGLGAAARVTTRGWLPYILHWTARVIESHPPQGFTIQATGDFVGCGRWSFEQVGDEVAIAFCWRIAAEKPLLRRLSWLLKPLFSWNHRWAMARGEEALRREVLRRRRVRCAE
jgi:hypothetical protein